MRARRAQQASAGDTVQIEESRPISKRKHWVKLEGPGERRAAAAGGWTVRRRIAEAPADPVVEPAERGGDAA
jgi:hypothetical protein